MADQSLGFTVEPEPENNILTLRVQQVVLDTPESLDATMPAILAGFQAMDWQPCYLLLGISGLRISLRLRTYLAAQGQTTAAVVRAVIVFSPHPDAITELMLRVGAAYDNIPYALHPDETAARADIARRRTADTHALPHLDYPSPFDTSGQ